MVVPRVLRSVRARAVRNGLGRGVLAADLGDANVGCFAGFREGVVA